MKRSSVMLTLALAVAVNVTDIYAEPAQTAEDNGPNSRSAPQIDVEASRHAVVELREHLRTSSPGQLPLDGHEFADVALTREDADTAVRLLWDEHVSRIKRTRAEEMKSRQLTVGGQHMPFFYTVSGDKPENGRSLYISMHGGGGAPKALNDRQWENQKRLYSVKEGVYLAPRAPTDAWNMWHQDHIDWFFDRLIQNLIVFEGVDPNRVYLLGYSAGGDGVYQLAPRMADRFAAAAMMAGHPNEASPLGLRNLPFTLHVGDSDGAYSRNTIARKWGEQLDTLHENDPAGYVHWTKIYEGKGHWLDRQDAAALPWMAERTRDPLPSRIVWRQDDVTHLRFYWLAVQPQDRRGGVEVRASLEGQHFDVQAGDIKHLVIRMNDRMLNLDEPVTITTGEKTLYKGIVRRSIRNLDETLDERGDPALVFSGEVVVTLDDKSE